MSTNRKSKHLIGTKSETDSDVDSTKRSNSNSKSPVKKIQGVPAKAKSIHNMKKPDIKNTQNEEFAPIERICPLNDCDSLGHLRYLLFKKYSFFINMY